MALSDLLAVSETREVECDKHGKFISKYVEFAKMWTSCPQCMDDAQKVRDQEAREQAARVRIERNLEAGSIPPRFIGCTLGNFITDTPDRKKWWTEAQDYADGFHGCLSTGTCLIFSGNVGTGKTHLSIGILKHIIRKGFTGRYTTVIDLIREVRDSWKSSNDSPAAVLTRVSRLGLLVIDEVGLQYGTDGEIVTLTEVIGRRYNDLRPTLIVTNENHEGLQKYLGDRAFDRLRENGGKMVLFKADSYRKGKS